MKNIHQNQITIKKYNKIKNKISHKKGGVFTFGAIELLFIHFLIGLVAVSGVAVATFLCIYIISSIITYIYSILFKDKSKKNLKFLMNEIYENDKSSINRYLQINMDQFKNDELSQKELVKIIEDTLIKHYKNKNIKIQDITDIINDIKKLSKNDKFRNKLKSENKQQNLNSLNKQLDIIQTDIALQDKKIDKKNTEISKKNINYSNNNQEDYKMNKEVYKKIAPESIKEKISK